MNLSAPMLAALLAGGVLAAGGGLAVADADDDRSEAAEGPQQRG